MNRLDLQRRHWIFTLGPALVVGFILLIVLLAVCGLGSRSYVNYNLTSSPAAQLTDPWGPFRAPRAQGTLHTTDLVVDNTETVGGTLDVTGLIGTSAQPHFGSNGIQINSFGGTLVAPFIRVWSGDPNTHVTGGKGSLVLDGLTPAIWVNTDGASAWTSLATGGAIAGTPGHLAEFNGPGSIGDSPFVDNGTSAITLLSSRILQIATTVTAGTELFSTGIIGAGGSAGSPSVIIHPVSLGADTIYAGFPTNNNNAELFSSAGNIFCIGGTASAIGNDPTTTSMCWNISTGVTTAGSSLDMTSHPINNVADPSSPQDALTLAYGNAHYGAGTVTGSMTSGTVPVATGPSSLGDSPIKVAGGVTVNVFSSTSPGTATQIWGPMVNGYVGTATVPTDLGKAFLVFDLQTMAAGVGGTIHLEGNINGTTTGVVGGSIQSSKSNSTLNDRSFDMIFATRNNAGSDVATALTLKSDQSAVFASSVAATSETLSSTLNVTGVSTLTGGFDSTGAKALVGKLGGTTQTDTSTGTVNDFVINASTTILRWSGTSSVVYNGFKCGASDCSAADDGRLLIVETAISTASITASLAQNNTSTVAGNRFFLNSGKNLSLSPDSTSTGSASALLIYDGASLRWRVVASFTHSPNSMTFLSYAKIGSTIFDGSATPTVNHGAIVTGSSNIAGSVTGIGSNTSVTLTLSPAFGTTSFCTATPNSISVAVETIVVTQSATAPVFSCYSVAAVPILTNCDDFTYNCPGL